MAPTDFLRQLRDFYTRRPDPVPPLSRAFVAWLSVAFTLSYVLPFYLSPLTRPSPSMHRDSPIVIRARIRIVTLSCGACALVTVYVLTQYVRTSRAELLRLLGWWPLGVGEIARALVLTSALFAGPLFERGVIEEGWREWLAGKALVEELGSWIGWRDFVAGPVSEEFLFRSLLMPLALLTPTSPARALLLTPLYFGLAHLHHLYEFRLTHPRVPLFPCVLRTLAQFAYTTLFGWYASFVFVRTGSLPAAVLAHAFCNWMGLPRVWGRVEGLDRQASGVVGAVDGVGRTVGQGTTVKSTGAGRGQKNQARLGRDPSAPYAEMEQDEAGRLIIWWTIAYYVLLVGGALAFWKGLWPLTESPRRLAELR